MKADFESVYRQNYQKLYTLAFRMTGNREDAEDVLQISFSNAYKAFDKFRKQSSAYTWLYRIVLNTAKRFYRERGKLPAVEYSEEHGITQEEFYGYINSFGRVEDEVLTELTKETCLQMFMNCMPSKYRAAYTLRIMLQLSTAETADILDISENAVKARLHRARNIARDHLDGRCSLIHPGAMCDCRSYAGYIEANGRHELLCDMKIVKNREKIAVEKYTDEMKEILQVDDLYNNQIKAPDYDNFLSRIRELKSEKRFRVFGD